eukprot:gnl/Dysnectes_brevis/2120_a2463_1276.p1 GENE.gnl/Dysnectes_brevis/2120_a2463_1276~~gnl/Dysnectes_brevis/2120_a2463_1276.p1  ORF type:complete len:406 (-),score=110.12 gnl/Dysnectes_brevis/2120_a2463_1276:121-1338(-)
MSEQTPMTEIKPTDAAVDSHVASNILRPSESVPEGTKVVAGPDLEKPDISLEDILESYSTIGYSASSFGAAAHEIKRMLKWRLSDDPIDPDRGLPEDPEERAAIRCKVFLGYTSNLVSSGLRSVIRFLVRHKMVDCVVSSAGGIEEDFIKCLAPTYLGDFKMDGAKLRAKSLNRIGNLIVPNDNYVKFEEWIQPIFDQMLIEQRAGYHWTPQRLIWRLGREIDHEDSIYYWAWKNQIPVFCPSITDGSIGDMLFFHTFRNPGLVVDVVADIRAMNSQTINSPKNGVIILGGGMIKHHILNANLFAGDGASFAVYVNTGLEFDGSDAGASPDEAVSWGKIAPTARPVKLHADATLVFPLLVAGTLLPAYREEAAYWDGKEYTDPQETFLSLIEEEAGYTAPETSPK